MENTLMQLNKGGKVKWIFAFLLLCVLGACTKDEITEDLLPDTPVYLQIDLNDARYNRLKNLGEYYEFTKKPTVTSYIGVGGILVVHTLSPMDPAYEYTAYDLYCTYEKNIRVEPQQGGIYAICPKCSSKYDISSGFGNCISGPAKQLRRYRASAAGNTLVVTK